LAPALLPRSSLNSFVDQWRKGNAFALCKQNTYHKELTCHLSKKFAFA